MNETNTPLWKNRWVRWGASCAAVIALASVGWSMIDQGEVVPGDATDLDQVAFGARIYDSSCAHCHGTELTGQAEWEELLKEEARIAPSHDQGGQTWRHSDQTLFKLVKFGGDQLHTDGKPSRMPAFDTKLSDSEIWATIAFIKSSWPEEVQEAQREASLDQTH